MEFNLLLKDDGYVNWVQPPGRALNIAHNCNCIHSLILKVQLNF